MKTLKKVILIGFVLLSCQVFGNEFKDSTDSKFNQQQLHAIKIIKTFKAVVSSSEITEENRQKIESAINKFIIRYQDISEDKNAISGNELALEVCSKRLDALIADMKQFII